MIKNKVVFSMPNLNLKTLILLAALLTAVGCINPIAYGDAMKGLHSKEYVDLKNIRSIGVFPSFTRYSEGGVPVSRFWVSELQKKTSIEITYLDVPTNITQKEFVTGLGKKDIRELVEGDELPDVFLTGEVIESDYVFAPLRGWYKTYFMRVALYDKSGQKLWEASVSNNDYLKTQKYDTVSLLAKALIADVLK